MCKPPTPQDVAAKMVQWLASGTLYQSDAVAKIQREFGKGFVTEKDDGTYSINRPVLDAFRKLTKDSAVWEPSGKYWRPRVRTDGAGRKVG